MTWQPQPGTPLTTAELRVLEHVAEGDTNGKIARRLKVSPGTIDSHLRSITRRLGAANRVHAVVLAHRGGYLPLDCGWNDHVKEAST